MISPEQWKCRTLRNYLFLFPFWFAHIPPTLSAFSLLMNQGGPKGRDRWLTLPCLLWHHLLQRRITRGRDTRKKDGAGFLRRLCFLEHQHLLSAFEASSGRPGRAASPLAQSWTYSHLATTLSLTSPAWWGHQHPVRGGSLNVAGVGPPGTERAGVGVSSAQRMFRCPITLHLQDANSKVKALRIPRR